MKKIILSSMLCMLLFQAKAQNNNYYNRMQHIFGNIDKNKVTTGYLKEFGIRFNTIQNYDGVNDANNFVDKTQWQSLYNSLYSMRVGSAAINMTATNTVFSHLKTQQNTTTTDVLLAMQHYNYQQYKTNAVSNGDVTISNERIYDVAGRNPYDTKTIFGITPLKKELQGHTFTFKLPNNLIYTNTGLTINQVQIDFDNGQGYQTVTLNTDKSISYTSGGIKELKYKITYTNNSILYSHSKILLDYTPNYQARYDGNVLLFNRAVRTGNAWNGATASGFVTIELAPGRTQLTKPLIVVEGFDPNNSFDYSDLVEDELYRGPGGLNIIIDNNDLTLNQAIENENYDLVFVDYANGTDFIQRNALMVENVIAWVNGLKANTPNAEPNVVLGMSMGGLVARYALRHMEQNNLTHDTELYISHDTPHQGANVPLGMQAMVRHLYGEEITMSLFANLFTFTIVDIPDLLPDLGTAFDLLQEPAAQQMLIYQLQGDGTNTSIINSNALSTAFYNEYHAMGNPIQGNIRNIAISSGSECGIKLPFADNASIINLNEKIDLPWFATNIVLGVLSAFNFNPLRFASSILSTDTDIDAVFRVKALPNGQSQEIYHGDIFISKTILWSITVHEQIIDDKTLNSQSSMLPLDNNGGGFYDIENFVGNLPSGFNSYILERQFSFVPTYSSLNIGGGNQTIQYADLLKSYSPLSPPLGLKNVPFDNFYSNPESNEGHIQFTANNGNWLLEELDDDSQKGFYSCASACSNNLPLNILGDNQVCTNNSANYSISNIAPEATINWSISPAGGFTLAVNSSNNITVTPNGNFGGIATLSAQITTSCNDTFTIIKEIQAGAERPIKYDRNGNQIGSLNFCALTWGSISFNIPETLEWEWRIGFGNFNLQAGTTNYAQVYSNQPTSGILEVRRRDACGWSPYTFFVINFSNCSGGGFRYNTFPNPTSDFINIFENETNAIQQKNSINNKSINRKSKTTATLHNLQGNVVRKMSSAVGKLDIKGLPSGQYVLLISFDGKTEAHHIIIE
tara:strand:+ start:2451 stop:5528 length:3078 start_codon:yes stop_codon:yes gene_type:complete